MRGPYLAVPRYLGVGTRHLYSRAHACASKIRDIAFRPPSPPPPRRRRTPRFRVTTVHGNEKFPGSRWTPVKYRARPSRRGWKWIVFTERGGEGGSSAEITGAWRFDANVAWMYLFRSIWSDDNRRRDHWNGYFEDIFERMNLLIGQKTY